MAEAREAGVERIVTIGMGRASAERAIALCDRYEGVHAAIGVHPHDADAYTPADDAWIRVLASHSKVVAIGECGLDYHRNHSAPAAQRRAFRAQIGLARELGLPLVVHTRDAGDDTLATLAEEPDEHSVVLHCFSLADRLGEVVERGYLTSFAGPLTYPGSIVLQDAARALPDDRLLVETDSPYLAPVPRRGRPNRPANVAHTLRFLAGLRGRTEESMDAITAGNAARVFGW